MKYRKLDNNGDYIIGRGTEQFLTDAEACAQAVKTNLGLLLAEWWEDVNDGLPLWQSMLGTPGSEENLSSIDNLIRARIAITEGVTEIAEYERTYNNDKRSYSFRATINTQWTPIQLDTSLNIGV